MNLKDGCGKTTIASHLAALLSILDFKVLLIDTDHQNQCRLFFPERSYENTLLDALEGSVLNSEREPYFDRDSLLDK
jgi:cellulose biosynthesis protein BcsQ